MRHPSSKLSDSAALIERRSASATPAVSLLLATGRLGRQQSVHI